MPSTRELRRRIKSVKNTSQITKAMEMVAATKMRKAQNQALMGRPYTGLLNYSLSVLLGKIQNFSHLLLQENNAKKTAVLMLTTDKSLCGALNTNVFRMALNFMKEKSNLEFYSVGKKGRNFIVKSGHELVADFDNTDVISFSQARQITRLAVQSFLSGEIREFYIIYPDFVTTLRQEPRIMKLLPIDKDVLEEMLTQELKELKGTSRDTDIIIEPDPQALVEFVLTHYLETKVYQALLETKASEHSARMIAMQNATNNARDLVQDLQLSYNQTRQDAITRELLEITSATAALE